MKRMQGFNTLWMPGTDHAGIATQAVVERRLKEDENKTRHDLGREALVKRIWDWKDQYETRILGQLKQMGCSCDFQRTRFTLDDTCATAVRYTFFDLFQKEKVYRGKRLVNWDTHLNTAVSDDEVDSKTIKGHFWHFMYPVIDPQPGEPAHVMVATTRPETMLGDTAVAVHPDPERGFARVASELMLPLMNREIPIVADEWAKPELGSGCVKITPAHDPNDYEVGKRCDLPMINIMNRDGTLNVETGKYAGLTMKAARKKVVEDLEALGLLELVEDRDIELPISDRSKTPIEPYLADQWFVAMGELAQSAMDAVSDGRVNIKPERYKNGYLDWLGEKRDWPVSRQLWWGHQIPVWVHVCVQANNEALEAQLTDAGLVREEDVLDTWFSSALWPHSTLGWPEKTELLEYFYPTSTLITSRDIITLWVARMVLMGLNNCGEIPFDQVYIHPKIQDSYGETMSKSKGNGIDPIEVIQKFGADSLRFGMAHLCTETQDVRVTGERFEVSRNFVNKLWNASRFAMLNLPGYEAAPIQTADLTVEDRWMLSRLRTVTSNVTKLLDGFSYAEATRELYDFAWDHFCSFYVEMLKDRFADEAARPHAQRMLAYVLDCLLRLLHPVMPYVTEEIWQNLAKLAPQRGFESVSPASESVCIADWPKLDASWHDETIEDQFALYQSALGAIREVRASQNIANKKSIKFLIRCQPEVAAALEPLGGFFSSMAKADLVGMGPDVEAPETNAVLAKKRFEILVDLEGLIDYAAEVKRLEKEQGNLEKSIGGKERQLGNEKFVAAKPDLAAEIQISLAQAKEQLATVTAALEKMKSKV
ncbi:UNVERIFIED_CONTAM: hypothetical protein GTU68_062505 [Idotea baltica]|nr:hypothetical protein [Idotea baltica]